MTILYLSFDIGTTGAKAALVAPDGTIVRAAYRAYPTHTADGGIVEQNAADWWRAVVESARELAAEDARIAAVALTGQMQDVILVNDSGEPLRPVLLYSDTRARAEASDVNARVPTLRDLTGNFEDAGSVLAKLRWLALHQPHLFAIPNARLLVGAADFIALRLTGNAVADTTTASTSGIMDICTRAPHHRDLFDRLGIGAIYDLLPVIHHGGGLAGHLTEDAARLLGLPAGIPVYHGPGDAGAATLGAGAGEVGSVYAYLGTSGWIAFTATDRATNEGVYTLAHPHPERFIQVAPLLTAGGNLEWVRDLFSADGYDSLIAQALERPSGLLYLPYLNGERAPFSDPLARGAFIGLSMKTTKADLYRAVLEGVVFAYRHALDALLDSPVQRLTLAGGGTRSQAWCQLFADILGVPVAITADAENVGVRGAVLAARVGADELDGYPPLDYTKTSAILEPDAACRPSYDRQYARFRDLYPALKPTFAALE